MVLGKVAPWDSIAAIICGEIELGIGMPPVGTSSIIISSPGTPDGPGRPCGNSGGPAGPACGCCGAAKKASGELTPKPTCST